MRTFYLILLLASLAFSYELSAEFPIVSALSQGNLSKPLGTSGVKIKLRQNIEQDKFAKEVFFGYYNDSIRLSDPTADLLSTFMVGAGAAYFIPIKYGFLLGTKSGGTYGISIRKKGGVQSSWGLYGAGVLRYNYPIGSKLILVEVSPGMHIFCMPRVINNNYFFRDESSILNSGGFKLEAAIGFGF